MTQPDPDPIRRQAFSTLLRAFRELKAEEQSGAASPEDSKNIVLDFCGALDAMRLVMLTREDLTRQEVGLFQQSAAAFSMVLMTLMLGDIGDDIGTAPFRSFMEELLADDEEDDGGGGIEVPAVPTSSTPSPASS